MTIDLCDDCHRTVHHTWTEKELAFEANTLELIKSDPRIVKWAEWVAKR